MWTLWVISGYLRLSPRYLPAIFTIDANLVPAISGLSPPSMSIWSPLSPAISRYLHLPMDFLPAISGYLPAIFQISSGVWLFFSRVFICDGLIISLHEMLFEGSGRSDRQLAMKPTVQLCSGKNVSDCLYHVNICQKQRCARFAAWKRCCRYMAPNRSQCLIFPLNNLEKISFLNMSHVYFFENRLQNQSFWDRKHVFKKTMFSSMVYLFLLIST